MTAKEFLARVEHWRLLLLPEWRLTVVVDATNLADDRIAEVATDDDYNHACVAFTRRARKAAPQEIDSTIVHELLHCLTREYRRTLDLVAPFVGEPIMHMLNARHAGEEERFVDRLSRAIAGLAA